MTRARLARRLASTVRLRSTAAAVTVTAVALSGTALVLVLALRDAAIDTVAAQARHQALVVATQLNGKAADGLGRTFTVLSDSPGAVQIVGPDGTVVAGTGEVGEPPLSALRPPPGHEAEQLNVNLPGEDDAAVVAAAGVAVDGRPHVVLVTASLGPVRDTVDVAVGVLGLVLPLLLLLIGATIYRLVGRALRPVEVIRAEVAAIEQADLSRRVPEPPGDDEIGELARTMNAMLGRLEASQRSQRRFVADASHELRSPLTTLRTHLDIAAADHGRLDPQAQAAMSSELARLGRLVEGLLLLTRADERGLPRARQEIDLDDLLNEERIRVRRTTSLRVDATLTSVKIHGDRGQLARVVRNLVDNATRFAATTVHLGLRAECGLVVLEVGDDGPGIPAPDRERVLGRFVRLDAARSGGGSGLGLAIVAEIATAHGGIVRVSERAGGGALFTVELPGATEDAEDV